MWVEKFTLSPVRNPDDDLVKTMPNINNPDPQNFLAIRAKQQAEEDSGAEPTAEQVIKSKEFTTKENETTGAKVEKEEEALA